MLLRVNASYCMEEQQLERSGNEHISSMEVSTKQESRLNSTHAISVPLSTTVKVSVPLSTTVKVTVPLSITVNDSEPLSTTVNDSQTKSYLSSSNVLSLKHFTLPRSSSS